MELIHEGTGEKLTLKKPVNKIALERMTVSLASAPALIGRGAAFGVESLGQFAIVAQNDETLIKVMRALPGTHKQLRSELIDDVLMASQKDVKSELKEPSFSYKTDPDYGLIEISVDGQLLAEWSYEDDPEESLNEFKKIYLAGMARGK